MKTVLFVALTLSAPGAVADDLALSASELTASCRVHVEDPQAPGAHVCAVYVQGVLDGALASGTYAAAEPESGRSAWGRRAARTRLGPRLGVLPLERNATCAASAQARTEFIERLVRGYDTRPIAPDASAAQLIAVTLAEGLPC